MRERGVTVARRLALGLLCLAVSCVLVTATAAPAAVMSSPVAETVPQLCAQTQQFVKGSAKYLASTARQRQAVDAVTNVACSILTAITPRLTPKQKAALIAGYKTVVTTLVPAGWLTLDQAATLKGLANQVDDLRPTAVISGPGSGTSGDVLAFGGGQSSDADGTIAGYAWSWGDGSPGGSGVSPSHTYANAGTFTITLVVTDDKGAQSDPVGLQVVVVAANIKPTAIFPDPESNPVGVALGFDGSQSSDPDGTIAAYTWAWGDGTADGSGVNPLHTYTTAGTYSITLVVTDDKGAQSDPHTAEIEIDPADDGGVCNPGLSSYSCACNTNMTLATFLGQTIASAVVVPAPSETEQCLLVQVTPEPNAGFPFAPLSIAADELFGPGSTTIANSPIGYTRITDAVQFQGSIGNNKVRICFTRPANADAFKSNRVAYYDTTPGINRWVFLTTKVDTVSNTACMTKGLFKPVPPVVYTLFGQN